MTIKEIYYAGFEAGCKNQEIYADRAYELGKYDAKHTLYSIIKELYGEDTGIYLIKEIERKWEE